MNQFVICSIDFQYWTGKTWSNYLDDAHIYKSVEQGNKAISIANELYPTKYSTLKSKTALTYQVNSFER